MSEPRFVVVESEGTFEQTWRDAYGTPDEWEHERDGEREPVYAAGDVFAQELADTREAERLKRERRA